MLSDEMRHAFSRLRSQSGASTGVVLMLALGIGLTTAMFTVVDALVLRPVPFQNFDRLARVRMRSERSGRSAVSAAVLNAWRDSAAFDAVEGFWPDVSLIETDAGLQA